MKLYGEANPAPNPRRVRIFLAEKGIDLPEIDIIRIILRYKKVQNTDQAREEMGAKYDDLHRKVGHPGFTAA